MAKIYGGILAFLAICVMTTALVVQLKPQYVASTTAHVTNQQIDLLPHGEREYATWEQYLSEFPEKLREALTRLYGGHPEIAALEGEIERLEKELRAEGPESGPPVEGKEIEVP
jgi:uncharacterized protein involved in exopolysaccharide biosynthesis